MLNNVKRSYQDADGQWWFRMASGARARLTQRVCAHCGTDFLTYPGKRQMHCSRYCGNKCDGDHHDGHDESAQPHYPTDRTGPKGSRWKGGRRIARGGYVEVFAPHHWSLKGTQRKYVREHRLVMEEMLGRPLAAWEQVHHKNGVRHDNRPENLELWVNQQPPGQRKGEGKPHCPTCSCYVL